MEILTKPASYCVYVGGGMMRTILIAILLLCTAVLGAEAEWTPSAAISLQYSGSVFTDGGNPGHDLWSSTRTSAELDAASFRLGCHMISAPVSISYISEGGMHGRLVMTDAFSAMLSIRYGLMLSERFALSASANAEALWHDRQKASSWRAGFSIIASFYAMECLSIEMPLSLMIDRESIAAMIGISLRFTLRRPL